MAFDLGTIWAEIGLNTKKLDDGLMKAQVKLANADKTINTFGQKLTLASTKLITAGGIMAGAVAAVGVASIKMAKDFDTSMRNVNSIAKLSETEFKNLSGEVLDLSRKVPQSAKVLADGLYDIASSGFAGADGMKVLEASAKAASAGMTDTATSAKGITAVLNAYGLEAEDAAEISDTMFRTVDKGVITFEELSGGIGNVISTANLANIEFNELSGMIAYMTTKGVSAEETMTALNRLILSIIDPTEQLAAVLKSAGYESGEAAIEALGLTGVLDLMDKAAGGSLTKLQEMSPEMRALKASGALLGSGIGELNEFMKDFKDTTGATNTALAEQQKSLDYQLKLLKNNISAIGISLGNQYIPKLAGATNAMSEFISEHKEGTIAAINLGLAAGGSVGSLLLLAGAIGKVRGALQLLSTTWLANPYVLAGAAIAGTITLTGDSIDKLAGKTDDFKIKIQAMNDALRKFELTQNDGSKASEELRTKLINIFIAARDGKMDIDEAINSFEKLGLKTEYVATAADDAAARHAFFNNAVKESRDVIDDYTPSIEEATEATENFFDTIFDVYLLTADLTEGIKSANEKLTEYNKAVDEFGQGSTEANEKQVEFIRQLDIMASTSIPDVLAKSDALSQKDKDLIDKYLELLRLTKEWGIITPQEYDKIAQAAQQKIATDAANSWFEYKRSVDTAVARTEEFKALYDSIKSKTVEIKMTALYENFGKVHGGYAYDSGGIIGMPKADMGYVAPQTGRAIPILAHEGEVILNSGQQANLAQAIWGVANGKSGGGVTVNLTINSPDPITPDEVARQTKNTLRLAGMEASL